MNNVVDREADHDDSGDRLGNAELPPDYNHDCRDIGNDEHYRDNCIYRDNTVSRGNEHDDEGERDTDTHTLQGTLKKGMLTCHEAPGRIRVLEDSFQTWWRSFIELEQEALPRVVQG